MKRLGVFIILACMILHCSSRLGFLSYLYEQREAIAFNLGLIDEIEIAVCSSDYDFDTGLHIEAADDSDSNMPARSVFQAREIQLFQHQSDQYLTLSLSLLKENQLPAVLDKKYTPPDHPVFHPPA